MLFGGILSLQVTNIMTIKQLFLCLYLNKDVKIHHLPTEDLSFRYYRSKYQLQSRNIELTTDLFLTADCFDKYIRIQPLGPLGRKEINLPFNSNSELTFGY